jgi:hypothetical protein
MKRGATSGRRVGSRSRSGDHGASSGLTGSAASHAVPPRTRWWLLAGLLAVATAIATFDPRLYINGDNVDFILQGRRVLGGDLWPSDKFPPLFPLLLAPVQLLTGESLIAQKLLVLAAYAGSVWLLARIVRRRAPGTAGPFLLWIGATLIPVIEFSHYTMTEVPFLFFLLGAVDRCDRLLDGSAATSLGSALRSRGTWLLGVWIAAAFYTRTVGVVAAAGISGALLLRGRRRECLALIIALGVLLVPWLAHGLRTPVGRGYVGQWLRIHPYHPELGRLDAAALLRRLGQNLWVYFRDFVPATILPVPYRSTYSPVENPLAFRQPAWVAFPLLVPLAVGTIRALRRADPAAMVLAVYFAVLMLWPAIWASNRFLVPVASLLFLYWWKGWEWRPLLPSAGHRRWVGRLALAMFLVIGATNLLRYGLETREYPAVWKSYFATLSWVREHTPPDAVIVDRKPGFVRYVCDRTARPFPLEKNPDAMLDAFREWGVTHVLLNSLPYYDIYAFLEPAVRSRKEYFAVAHQVVAPRASAIVFRFYPDGRPGADLPSADR